MSNKVTNKWLAVSFIVFFALNIFLPSIIYLNFKLNQEYIAANLCEEKDIEESTCNGNCQLKKTLDVVEQRKPKQDNFSVTIESHITSLFLPSDIEGKLINPNRHLNVIGIEKDHLNQGFIENPFRPPILS